MEIMDDDWMKNSELREIVINRFNEEFGSDISILDEFMKPKNKLEMEKSQIGNALSVNSNDVSSKISSAIKHVQEALENIEELSQQHCSLKDSVANYQEKVNKVKMKAEDYINKINDLEKACEYLKIIEQIGEVSNVIESGLNDKNERKQVMYYLMLRDIYRSLRETKCRHLFTFANETLHYWHNILKERFGNDYEDLLKVIKWPFVGNHLATVPTAETLNRFQILTEFLLQIELDDQDLVNSVSPEFGTLSLPMIQLIKPLRKRFIYHFMGPRQTNRMDKPEWYFTQVLAWIRDHQDFIEKNVQPAYDKIKRNDILAKAEFMKGLTQIVVEKLHFELPQLYYDDSLFSHCIDEALGFDRELKKSYGYPADQPSVISVLTQAQIFVKWINMEKRYATEKMDKILSSETAFETFVSRDIDENRVTECAESFLALLSTITERYEMLPEPGHRLQFLQLQLDLIDDFRIRLLEKLKEENLDPLIPTSIMDSKFPNILNTVNYIRTVLQEWGVNTFFLHLYFYKAKLEGRNEFEGTVFDDYLNLFAVMKDDYLTELIDQVFMDIKAKSMPYRKDKWHAMESPKDVIQPTITPTACAMFQVLINRLHQLQDILASSLFQQSWSVLAAKLDQYIYEEIAAICIFNEGGALQFNYDITRNLFPLFAQYSSKPEAHFKLLKDSCTVLSMPIGLALTLVDTLKNSVAANDQYDENEVLAEVGIYTLKKGEVLSLLSRRRDLS